MLYTVTYGRQPEFGWDLREFQYFNLPFVTGLRLQPTVVFHDRVPVLYTHAPVAYQVVLEPGIGQFREFESPRAHTRITSWGLFLVHKLICGKRESVSGQHSMKNRRAVGLLNPMRDLKLKARTGGEEGATPVTTACPEAGK